MSVNVFQGDAFQFLQKGGWIRHFDLVLTSPPAYPSPKQDPGAFGTEATVEAYVNRLADLTSMVRWKVKTDGIFCLIIQEQAHRILEPLAQHLQEQDWKVLGTYRWQHGDAQSSWVVFLTQGKARLNHQAACHGKSEWMIPWDTIDPSYGFYEFPQALVDNVVSLTMPKHGGHILDPFIGKGTALSKLGPSYRVTGIDLLPTRKQA